MPENLSLRETTATSLSEAAVNDNGQALLRLIAPGWSANGRYYSESVLKQDGLQAFRSGTKTFIDHPSKSAQIDRPERSVRDLVGTLQENAYYDPSGPAGPGLYARASVREEYRPLVDELAESIGMSIRADGTGHRGEVDGRTGMIVDSIETAESVDYVTTPAAGGKVIQLLESVQSPTRETEPPNITLTANVRSYIESMRKAKDMTQRMAEATANEVRDALSNAIRERYTDDRTFAYVRDFDGSTVWFEIDSGEQTGTWQQDYTIDDNMQVTLSGDPVEVRVEYSYVPISTPASQPAPVPTTVNESTPHREDTTMTAITEAEAKQLRETVEQARNELAEARKERDEANAERDRIRDADRIRANESAVSEAVNAIEIPASLTSAADGIRSRAAARIQVTRDSDGNIVRDALTEAARREVTSEITYLSEATGAGRPSGLGGNPANPTNTTTTGTDDTLTALDESLDGVFGKILQEA